MGKDSSIAWCDHTFNPWIGCMKVSAGCDHCYAETLMDKRHHTVVWGQRRTESTEPSVGTRARTSANYWRQPLAWARKARKDGSRPKVFCASLADVFDNQVPEEWRRDLWALIEQTPELTWLLLTKRPQNIARAIPGGWHGHWPDHVWIGATCEDQAAYDERWPLLREMPAPVRFISYEPALGPLSIKPADYGEANFKPHWIICGGESGSGFRPMQESWARDLARECDKYLTPFFMKQMAGVRPQQIPIPSDLLIRQFPFSDDEEWD